MTCKERQAASRISVYFSFIGLAILFLVACGASITEVPTVSSTNTQTQIPKTNTALATQTLKPFPTITSTPTADAITA